MTAEATRSLAAEIQRRSGTWKSPNPGSRLVYVKTCNFYVKMVVGLTTHVVGSPDFLKIFYLTVFQTVDYRRAGRESDFRENHLTIVWAACYHNLSSIRSKDIFIMRSGFTVPWCSQREMGTRFGQTQAWYRYSLKHCREVRRQVS